MIWRCDLLHLKHNPLDIASNLIFPIVMVVLLGYVFSSAIHVPGGSYRSYVMPGLFVMAQVSAMGTLALGVRSALAALEVAMGPKGRRLSDVPG